MELVKRLNWQLLINRTLTHFIMYYALHMSLQGRPWNDCKGEEKKALCVSFDKIKKGSFDESKSELERMLNLIGVVDAKP